MDEENKKCCLQCSSFIRLSVDGMFSKCKDLSDKYNVSVMVSETHTCDSFKENKKL